MDLEQIEKAHVYIKPLDYYVLGSVYPPLKAMQPIAPDEMYAGASDDLSLYVHIPFCDQYCSFCHFAKVINPSEDRVERYLRAMYLELEMLSQRLGGARRVRTIYFGGGTASYLTAAQVRELFARIHRHFDVAPDAEITYELHPNLVRRPDCDERLESMLANGVNRWVFGVQSMDNRELAKLNRGHTDQDVLDLLAALRERGQENVSLDLIFGIPYQTLESWHQTLTKLVAAGTPKFNIFPLMFKSGDPITYHYLKEPEIFPDASDRILMHFICDHVLLDEAGYRYGPVFYYSKKNGIASQQQAGKFENIDNLNLLGIGVSAFGYLGGTHYYNVCEIEDYVRKCEARESPVWVGWALSEEDKIRRNAIMSIRASGISRPVMKERFGIDPFEYFADDIAILKELALVEEQGDALVLTRLGALHADGVGTRFVGKNVLELFEQKNAELLLEGSHARKDLMERYDYSPLRRRVLDFTKDLREKAQSRKHLPVAPPLVTSKV
ncbi:coproporphyrinogen-III oxidase family protein [Pendulispora albinea]|uniref:Coproporphyrinogen III oxidase family protein n=1 Tax=Pendulispora albinea TaxID=2741071 RepID=A0ABZ2LLC5_9BACT